MMEGIGAVRCWVMEESSVAHCQVIAGIDVACLEMKRCDQRVVHHSVREDGCCPSQESLVNEGIAVAQHPVYWREMKKQCGEDCLGVTAADRV